ncbi:MAG TPA: SAM-dependent chlorinase/fluorinase [Phycisphaerae bacterium]|mgnify:CR=1 FL=1|nr:SAM-dependent chlorinase/fluorinase [Phycisphaerae bacterium]HPS52217.1 SAM-dependent chlorinase/fluorinase [Phycisphaerae bacterium]
MGAIVTITSDYGLHDPYVGILKGQIFRHCPDANIVDISHTITPCNILEAAFIIAGAAPYFPAGTLHVVAVDPHGTDRNIIAAQFQGQLYIFPDNGVITLIKEMLPLEAIVAVEPQKFLPREIVDRCHGRDILAPLAGAILKNIGLSRLGHRPHSFKLLELPKPLAMPNEIVGSVMYVDSFGNMISNITGTLISERWPGAKKLSVVCNTKAVDTVTDNYASRNPGEAMAVVNPMGLLEIAVVAGRACDTFDAKTGTEIRVSFGKFLDA